MRKKSQESISAVAEIESLVDSGAVSLVTDEEIADIQSRPLTEPKITITTGRSDKKVVIAVDLAVFAAALTAGRIATLRYIANHPGSSVADVARGISGDYKRVRNDVIALTALGLLPAVPRRHGVSTSLTVTPGKITATIEL